MTHQDFIRELDGFSLITPYPPRYSLKKDLGRYRDESAFIHSAIPYEGRVSYSAVHNHFAGQEYPDLTGCQALTILSCGKNAYTLNMESQLYHCISEMFSNLRLEMRVSQEDDLACRDIRIHIYFLQNKVTVNHQMI